MQFSRSFRHRLTLEAVVCWHDEHGHEHTAMATTRDVNSQGVFLDFNRECPPEGTTIAICALLPAFLQRNGVTYLRGPGIVKRVEPGGFALHGDFRIETDYAGIFADFSQSPRLCFAGATP